jgi:hypothetical protein
MQQREAGDGGFLTTAEATSLPRELQPRAVHVERHFTWP